MKKLLSLMLVLSFAFSGCASTTVIKTKPTGAKVFVDDQLLGQAPVEYSDSSTIFTTPEVRVEADGYKPVKTSLNKKRVRVWPIIGAVLVLVPVLWVTGYADEYNYELQPENPSVK